MTRPASRRHLACSLWWVAVAVVLLLAGCATAPRTPAPAAGAGAAPATPAVATGEFVVAAHELDTWNAVGQLLVRMDGMRLDARSEMLDLHVVHYRGQDLLILTRGIPLADGASDPSTRVATIARDGGATDSPATRELLAILQRELPAEILRVRALQAREAAKP